MEWVGGGRLQEARDAKAKGAEQNAYHFEVPDDEVCGDDDRWGELGKALIHRLPNWTEKIPSRSVSMGGIMDGGGAHIGRSSAKLKRRGSAQPPNAVETGGIPLPIRKVKQHATY